MTLLAKQILSKIYLTSRKYSIKMVRLRTKRGADMEKNEIGKYIQIVSRQLKRNMDEALSCYNVTGVQSMLIGYIYEKSKNGEVFARDIEEEFDMRKATVAGIVQLMESNGLILRKSNQEDFRLKSIVLTKKALEIEKISKEQISIAEKNIVKEMTEEEQKKFLELLKKASKNLENYKKK